MIASDVAQAAANISALIEDEMRRLCSVLVQYFFLCSQRENDLSSVINCKMFLLLLFHMQDETKHHICKMLIICRRSVISNNSNIR